MAIGRGTFIVLGPDESLRGHCLVLPSRSSLGAADSHREELAEEEPLHISAPRLWTTDVEEYTVLELPPEGKCWLQKDKISGLMI